MVHIWAIVRVCSIIKNIVLLFTSQTIHMCPCRDSYRTRSQEPYRSVTEVQARYYTLSIGSPKATSKHHIYIVSPTLLECRPHLDVTYYKDLVKSRLKLALEHVYLSILHWSIVECNMLDRRDYCRKHVKIDSI